MESHTKEQYNKCFELKRFKSKIKVEFYRNLACQRAM